MEVFAFDGPLTITIKVLAFVLVVGALFVIVHALRRPTDRWRFAWTRWIWVLLSTAFVLSLVFALIWPNNTTYTIVGFAYLAVIVVEVAYLLRVVFPGSGKKVPRSPSAKVPSAVSDDYTVTAPDSPVAPSKPDTFEEE